MKNLIYSFIFYLFIFSVSFADHLNSDNEFHNKLDLQKDIQTDDKINKVIFPKKNISDFDLLANSNDASLNNTDKIINPYQQYFLDVADDSAALYTEFENSINSYEIVMERVFNTIISPGSLEFDSNWYKRKLKIKLKNNMIPENIKFDFDYAWIKNDLKFNFNYDIVPEDFNINLNYDFMNNRSSLGLRILFF